MIKKNNKPKLNTRSIILIFIFVCLIGYILTNVAKNAPTINPVTTTNQVNTGTSSNTTSANGTNQVNAGNNSNPEINSSVSQNPVTTVNSTESNPSGNMPALRPNERFQKRQYMRMNLPE